MPLSRRSLHASSPSRPTGASTSTRFSMSLSGLGAIAIEWPRVAGQDGNAGEHATETDERIANLDAVAGHPKFPDFRLVAAPPLFDDADRLSNGALVFERA